MSIEEKREPVRILDLMCGDGGVRRVVAERYPRKDVEYMGIDPYAPSEDDDQLGALLKEGAARRGQRFNQAFHAAGLPFSTSEQLSQKLKQLVGERQFDEIHLHMPDLYGQGRVSKGTAYLKVVAGFLKPGGRFYFTSDAHRPHRMFLDEKLEHSGLRSAVKANAKVVARSAASAGLKLQKYLHQLEPGKWRASRWIGVTSVSKKQLRELSQYSENSDLAVHHFVLRKPK